MKARKIQNRAARAPMFSRSSVGTAVAMALIAAASGAQAAETTVGAAYNGSANGTPSVNAGSNNTANVNAAITGASVGTTSTGTPSTPNPVAMSTSGNLIGATATGNSFANGIQPAPGLPVNNAATLGVATNSGVINSSVTGSKLAVESSTLQSGSVVNADNTISATTTLNSGSSVVSGAAPVGAPAQAGTSVLTYPAGAQLFDAKGNIVVTSLQSATGAGSGAALLGNTVDLMLTANAGNTITTAAALERNSIAAVLKANSASNTAEIQSGGAPSFAGSAVVANLQANGNGILAVTHSATNTGSVIMGIVSGAPAGGANVLQGSLSVQGNAISSAATGNEALGATAGVAGNRILIDDVSIAGTGTAATAANNSTHNGVGVTSNVNSDLAIVNSQGNIGVTTFARTMGAQVLAGVQSSKNSQLTLADNSITAAATGNTASSAIASGQNAASFTGTAAVSNQQANSAAAVTAFLMPSVIAAQTGESPGNGQTTGSTVTVSDNTTAATAQGNQVTQSLALQAATVALGNGNAVLSGGTATDGRVSASGAATLTNLQGNYNDGGAAALNVGSQIQLAANGGGAPVANNTLALSGNRQEAVALGSGASNTLTLTGNSVGTGAGIASVQMNDASSGVGAGLSDPEARIGVNGNLSGGSAAVAGNLQRAIAYGNSATNTLGVSAGNLAAAPGPILGAAASTVTVDLASGLPFSNAAGALPTVRAAYGVLNDQSVQATVNSAATGPNTFAATVNGNVSAASVSNSGNAFVGAAYGNDAASGVALGLNNVSGSNASIANVTNTQAVASTNTKVSAIAAGGIVARTIVAGTLTNGSVSSTGNTAEALAYGSRATANTVKVTGNNIDTAGLLLSGATLVGNALSTTAAFSAQSAQSGQGSVSAQRSGGPEVQVAVTGAVNNSKVDASGNTTLAGATSNSAANGVSVNAVGVSTTTAVQNLQLTSAAVGSLTGQEGALLTNKDGVQVVLGGSIQGSQVMVDGNTAGGSATGNAAANSIDVKGNTIAVGNGLPLAGASSVAGTAGAVGDHAVSSIQLVTSPTISSRVAAAFGVDTAPGAAIGGSTLSASGNTQGARAVANTGSNAIALAATDVSARSALLSAQGSTAAVESRSFQQVFAPASVSGSSVKLSNNGNTALGVINDVSNKVSVAGGTSGGIGVPAVITQGALPGNTIALGDQVLVNRQSAGTSVTSTADTAIYNEDRLVPANAGLNSSSFTASGNSTYSEASANRATNAASLAGGASQSAKVAVLNAQDSGAAVTASANNATKLTLTGNSALVGSSATLDGNSTSAAATGSAATNSIDVKSGGAIAGGLAALPATTTGPASSVIVSADQALANVQLGAGAVSATATGVIGIDTAPLSNVGTSTLGVTNNSQSAKAVSNTVLNSVALAGSNVSARSALQSTQSGTAQVTASSTLELFAPVASSASTIRISGNSNTALGVMNDAANSLSVSAVNALPPGATGSATLSETGSADNLVANGDHVLSNRQSASSTVSSTASTSIHNDDNIVPGTQGLANGALTISGNSTFAEASANRAANTVTVAGSGAQGASTGIANVQGSTATVTATAGTVANTTLAGAAPLNGSSVSLDGNTTAALARGNSATNLLESGGGSGYGVAAAAGSSSLVASPLALNVGASAAILNSQNNAGVVTATSTGTSYQVALNGTGAGVSNGTVGVTGNALAAQAFGNSATNRVTQTALNTGTPSAAIANYQVNTGAVTATVTSVNFGVGVTGAVGNSTLRSTGNQITASATGNSSVSTITAR